MEIRPGKGSEQTRAADDYGEGMREHSRVDSSMVLFVRCAQLLLGSCLRDLLERRRFGQIQICSLQVKFATARDRSTVHEIWRPRQEPRVDP